MNGGLWVVLMALSAALYRIGGAARGTLPLVPRWAYHGRVRDVGCMACVLSMAAFGMGFEAPWWAWGASAVLMVVALSTYWDWTGADNFYLHGVGAAGALLFVAPSFGGWVFYVTAVGVGMGLWSHVFENDHVEELGRGAMLVAFMPLLGMV